MCYYSKSLRAGTFREATANDDIVMASDREGHHFARSKQDGMILCLRMQAQVHIASLRVRSEHFRSFSREFPRLADKIGQPVTGSFIEAYGEHSNDRFIIDDRRVPFAYFEDGMEFYIGDERQSKGMQAIMQSLPDPEADAPSSEPAEPKGVEPDVKHVEPDVKGVEPDVKHVEPDVKGVEIHNQPEEALA